MPSYPIKILIPVLSIICLILACSSNQKKEDSQISTANRIDAETEISKWKKYLINSKRLGTPCDFKNLNDPKAKKWREKNPRQMDGVPKKDSEIHSVKFDFDSDGKLDLLLYFNSKNCTGHNGGSPSFAKIIYADGTVDTQLMERIRTAILLEYDKKRKSNSNLKEITNNYMKQTTSISFKGKITGNFSLYTSEDAHCCPSYTGNYTYLKKNNAIEIEVLDNQN